MLIESEECWTRKENFKDINTRLLFKTAYFCYHIIGDVIVQEPTCAVE